jgi:HSP20 family molecular chaperone IbpA
VAGARTVGVQDHEITQDDKQFVLKLDLPGIAKEHLSVRIEGAIVRIESKPDAARRYRAAYEFGQDIDSAASTAALEHGVLTLTLAKLVPVRAQAELVVN